MSSINYKIMTLALLLSLLCAATATATTTTNNNEFTLGEVIVTGEQQVVNLATTVNEVSTADLKARGAETAADALKMLPGVDVQTGGKGQSYVSIRGFEQSDLKVLIDGVPVYEQYYRSLDLSQIPVDSIAKVTVTKGASSVLYGANTMGGVINIITKRGTEKPTTDINASFGDYETKNVSISHGGTYKAINYWLNYSFRESAGLRLSDDFDENGKFGIETSTDEDGGKMNGSDYTKQSINAKIGYVPSKNTQAYLTLNYIKNEKGIPASDWHFDDWQQYQVSLVGEHRFNQDFRVKARAFYVDHTDTLEDVDYSPRDWFLKSAYDNFSAGGELQAFLNMGQYSFVRMGANFTRDNSQQKEIAEPGERWVDAGEFESDTYSLALEDEIELSEWLSVVVGTSWDYFDPRQADDQPVPSADGVFNPQIGIVLSPTDSTSVHMSVGKKTRFPHLKELYSRMSGGNPDLKPQQTTAYEIGVDQVVNGSLSTSLTYFYNSVTDLIDKTGSKSLNTVHYENIGEARIQGVEASLNADLSERLHANLNYTYMNTLDKEQDRQLESRPRHRANLDLRYLFQGGQLLSTQLSYSQRQFYEFQATRRADPVWTKAPDYFLVNMRFEHPLPEFAGVDSKLYLQVDNLTDKDYINDSNLMPGRTFLLGMNARF